MPALGHSAGFWGWLPSFSSVYGVFAFIPLSVPPLFSLGHWSYCIRAHPHFNPMASGGTPISKQRCQVDTICGGHYLAQRSLSRVVPQTEPLSPALGCFPNFSLPWPPGSVPAETSGQYCSFPVFPESTWVLRDPEQRIQWKVEDLPWDTPTGRGSPVAGPPLSSLVVALPAPGPGPLGAHVVA